VTVQVRPGEQFAAEREMRQRMKRTFDAQGVEIPFPQRTVHAIDEGSGPARTPDPLTESDVDSSSPPESAD
jgi:small conductance mechanosensitive channel